MSLSIEELDATVNAFYNGKGEAVSETSSHLSKVRRTRGWLPP